MAVQNPSAGRGSVDEEIKKLSFELERGSSFRLMDTLFGEYDSGAVFEYDFSSLDIRKALEKDGKLSCIEQALTLPILSAGWRIVPAEGGEKVAEELETFLRMGSLEGGMQTPFNMVIAQATSARGYRKAFFEKVYKEQDGKVFYDKIAYRPPETCRIARDPRTGAYMGFRQTPVRQGTPSLKQTDDIDVRPPYAWVHINGMRRNPLSGVSDLQVPLWCHETKMKILYLWTTFLATQAEPRLMTSGGDPEDAARRLAALRGGGVVGLPNGVEARVLESNGTAAQSFQDMINYLDTQMSASVLAGFTDLASGATGTGSYALSQDQSDFFVQSLEAYSTELAESITHNVLGDLVVYNHGRSAKFPKFEFEPLADGDVDRCITLLQGLSNGQSVLPFEFVEELAMKTANYLEMDTDKLRDAMEEAAKVAEEKAAMALESQRQGIEGQKAALAQGGAPGKPGAVPAKGSPAEKTAKNVAGVAAKVGVAAKAVQAKQAKETGK
ncbi:portal protein [Streptomyces phage Araceli]|nr:portal protein [Streptomyces phage Henoccus]AWY07326.1 portal protein [Streptomyces phage JackieB]QFG07821.1 portal protein [Streptomyces phage Araceli]